MSSSISGTRHGSPRSRAGLLQGILEAEPRPAPQLSTFVPIQDDKIRLGTMEIRAFGKARFKAFGATPPIFVPRVRYTESEIELVQIHEMRPVDERLLRKLRLGDDLTRERAGADIALGQQALAIRNERQSDWMVMTALLTGQLPIQFEDEASQGFVVDYGFKATTSDGHHSVVEPGVCDADRRHPRVAAASRG
jgi:hypothetical protein